MPTMSQLKWRAGALLACAAADQQRIDRIRAEIVDMQLDVRDIFPEGCWLGSSMPPGGRAGGRFVAFAGTRSPAHAPMSCLGSGFRSTY